MERVMSSTEKIEDRLPPATRLKPYLSDPEASRPLRSRLVLTLATVVFCFLYGALYSFFSPYVIAPFAVPVAVIAPVVLWALPQARTAPTQTLVGLFFVFFVGLVIWPNYLAIAIPGLPWITVMRLIDIPLVVVLLYCVSTSQTFRSQLADILKAAPLLWQVLAVFVAIQFLTIALSREPAQSLNRFIIAQLSATAVFFVSCYVLAKPGRIGKWAAALWALAVVVCGSALLEHRLGHVPWAGHIPSFLKVEDPSVVRALAGQSRAATGFTRAQGTFSTSLGLAEFLALVTPFVIHFVMGAYHWMIRVFGAFCLGLFLWVILLTDSRLGVVGYGMSLILYLAFWALLRWKHNPRSLFGPAVALAYPAIFCATIASTFLIGRIRAQVWGNGPQTASTAARTVQYHMGFPKVLSHPFGHGIGMAGDALGYFDQSGLLTIDTYYLAIALNYGILGFIVFYGMFIYAIYLSARPIFQVPVRGNDLHFFIPISISLANFLVIKSVFAQEDNLPIAYALLGSVVALLFLMKKPGTPGTVAVRVAG